MFFTVVSDTDLRKQCFPLKLATIKVIPCFIHKLNADSINGVMKHTNLAEQYIYFNEGVVLQT